MSDLRTTIMSEQDLIASKMRFALFSQPPPLAIGDDSLFRQKKRTRGHDGKPITQPSQLLSGPSRSGKSVSSYFQVPGTAQNGDPYKDRYKQDLAYDQKMHTRSKQHEREFTPASVYRTITNSSYVYMEQNPQKAKKVSKNEIGRVKTNPRNFFTNPMAKVDTEVFKQLKHIADPYGRQRQMGRKQREANNAKLPKDVPPFNSTVCCNGPLVKDSLTYCLDDKAKRLMADRKANRKANRTAVGSTVRHEVPFRPVSKYPEDLGKFPEHAVASKSREKGAKDRGSKEKDRRDREKWRPNTLGLTRPTPSILLLPKNLHHGGCR